MYPRKPTYNPDLWIEQYKSGMTYKQIGELHNYTPSRIMQCVRPFVDPKKVTIEKINSQINTEADKGCWEWTGCVNGAGYGCVSYEGKIWLIHRLFYQLHRGDVGSMHVLHKCDNRKCCNPEHLFLGTRQDNMQDMHSKGRDRHSRKRKTNNG